ncbi:MAG: tRNA (adenosine(37)-N6)-dimethylallyltransferase MiaA [Candidatus Rokubacteria bacterium]|nr:tRNA (adenosine(37)-N6)-dimethylallyltransferase MiaA [Candidatus Rokubacteria bacterium]
MDVERTIPLIVIVGPTGVGKTAAAVALARRLPIEVVSADSRQVYRGMDVATGKPTAAERAAVPHHLIDVIDPDDRYSAARFRVDAAVAIEEIHRRGRIPAVVGGTGLYVRSLLRGLDPAPPADLAYREELAGIAAREGRSELHARLQAASPVLARRLHPNDTVRVIRALERLEQGMPALDERQWQGRVADYAVTYVGLTMDRRALARRLHGRAAAMVAAGLEDEVRALLARGHGADLPALHGIGYREFVRVIAGGLERDEALRLMQRDTVRYAKRQWTWFQREPDVTWIDVERAGGPAEVALTIEQRRGTEEARRG